MQAYRKTKTIGVTKSKFLFEQYAVILNTFVLPSNLEYN